MKASAITLTLAALILAPEPQSIDGGGTIFSVPDGALPWPLPVMPAVSFSLTEPTLSIDSITHTTDYATDLADLNARFDSIEIPVEQLTDAGESFIGPSGITPDMSGGDDFQTGLDPAGTGDMTAYDFASAFGGNIGTAFAYARALGAFDVGSVAFFLTFLMICIVWMGLVMLVKFALHILDAVISLVGRLLELIPVVE